MNFKARADEVPSTQGFHLDNNKKMNFIAEDIPKKCLTKQAFNELKEKITYYIQNLRKQR